MSVSYPLPPLITSIENIELSLATVMNKSPPVPFPFNLTAGGIQIGALVPGFVTRSS